MFQMLIYMFYMKKREKKKTYDLFKAPDPHQLGVEIQNARQ